MDFEFITWDYATTFAGCLAIVMAFTEVTKNIGFIKKIPTQLTSWIYSFVIMILGQIFTGTFTVNSAFLAVINSVFISLTANGGYEALSRIFSGNKKTE